MNAVIQNDLAAMLTKGIGTDKNPEKVLFWLNKAAEQNFPEAQYNLGLMYDSGNYVTKDRKKALEFYQLIYRAVKENAYIHPGWDYLRYPSVTIKSIE